MAMQRYENSPISHPSLNQLVALGNRCDVLSAVVNSLNTLTCSVLYNLKSELKDLGEIRDILAIAGIALQYSNKGTQTEDTNNIGSYNTSTNELFSDKTESDLCVLCDSFQVLEQIASLYDESAGKSALEKKLKKLKIKSSRTLPSKICDGCFKKFAKYYQNFATNSGQRQQEISDKSRSKKHTARGEKNTDLQEFPVKAAEVPITSPNSGENGLINDLTPPKEVSVKPVARKRGRPRKRVDEPPDLSKLDPEHGSGLQVEWLLVSSQPPSQKYTCKRTRSDRSSKKDVADQLECAQTNEIVDSANSENVSQAHESSFNCAHCLMTFPSKSEAFLHKLTKHSKDVSGVCVQNEKKGKTVTAKELQASIHNTASTPSTEKFPCDLCNSHFKGEYSLFIHKTEVHNIVASHQTHNFKSTQVLLVDENINKLSPATDDVSTNEEANKSSISDIKNDSVGPKNCPFCNKYLPSQFYVDKHCEEVHGRYVCSMCEGIFYDKEEHSEHVASHGTCYEKFDFGSTESSRKINTVHTIYQCEHCSKKFSSQRLLLSHQEKVCKPSEFKCDKCGECFKNEMLLNNHMSVHVDCDYPFECAKCDRKFPNNDSLKEHQEDHLGDKFICSTCGDEFLTVNGLEKHNEEAHKNRLPYPCCVCGKRYPNEVSLKAHKSIHKKRGDYVCDVCDKSFFLKHNLKRHKIIHPPKQIFKCLLCFKAFSDLALLLKHKAIHHFDRTFFCTICMSYFSCLSTLQKHRLKEHTYQEILEARQKRENISFLMGEGATKYQCESCDKIFQTKQILYRHMRSHKSKALKCPYCTRHFSSRVNLNKHMQSHGGEELSLCNECGESFLSAELLTQHMAVHTNDKNILCPYCDKTFRWQHSLEIHILSHERGKKFPCTTCNRPFINKSALLKHVKSKVCQPSRLVGKISNGISGAASVKTVNSSLQANSGGDVADSSALNTNEISEEIEYDVVMDDDNFIQE